MPYNDLIVNLAENPEHIGLMDEDDPNVGIGEDGAPACGDLLKVYIRVDKNDVIEDVKFKIFGCGSAIASSEFMAKTLMGKNISNLIEDEPKQKQNNQHNYLTLNSFNKLKSQILQNEISVERNENLALIDLENLNSYIAQELKLPPIKFHCSVLAKDAISKAIDNLKQKRAAQNVAS
jgi:nitrogen fixation NifU-like protein